MKIFSQLNKPVNENKTCLTADVNPGNCICRSGVMNHYTPIENIVINVRNLFATMLGCIVCVGEDNVSLKMHSTKFVNKPEIDRLINLPIFNCLSVKSYIMQQGLDLIKMINVGQYWVVYFCPRDIPQATTAVSANPECGDTCGMPPCCPDCGPCESYEYELPVYYSGRFIKESEDDVEKKDITRDKIKEILNMKDKNKAAKQLGLVVANEIELPREYYFAVVVNDKILKADKRESIALRWRYITPQPFGQSIERTRSLMNIYGFGDEAVWVQDFGEDALFKIPEEVRTLIENILEILGAEENTSKKPKGCVWKIEEEEEDKDKDKDEDKSKDEKSDKSDDSDNEDDDSRGDSSDDLLG